MWHIASELFPDHFVYSSDVGKNQKVPPHCTYSINTYTKSVTTADFPGKPPVTQEHFANPVQKHKVYFMLLWPGFCLESSALPTALTRAGLWGTCLENLCAPSIGVARTVGKQMLSQCPHGSGGSALKTEALFLIILWCANSYLPQTVNFYYEIVFLHWNVTTFVSPATHSHNVLPPQLCLSKCWLQ